MRTIITKFIRPSLALALTAQTAFISSPLLAAQPTLFGAAKLSVAAVDDDNGSAVSVTSHSSRVGVKGTTQTEDGLEIIYRFVWQIDMTDEAKASNDFIKSREQYVGFKDNWGEVRVGRHDTPYKRASRNYVEFFTDTWGDYNNIISKKLDTRADDSVSYYSNFDQVDFKAMYAAGDDSTTGDNTGNIVSASAEIKLDNIALGASFQDTDGDALGVKLVAGMKTDNATFGIIVEHIDPDNNSTNFTGGDTLTNVLVGLKHKLDEKHAIRLATGIADGGTGNDPKMFTAAIDHKLNKKTTVYVLASVGKDGGLSGDAKLVGDAAVAAVGVVAKF